MIRVIAFRFGLLTALAAVASACSTVGPATEVNLVAASQIEPDADLEAHVSGFTNAYCLRSLHGKGLPDEEAKIVSQQGQRWTNVVVQQSRGDIQYFLGMIPSIEAAITATPMAMVKDEETAGSATASIFYCSQITQQPGVARAMAEAKEALAPAYAEE